jgi:dTMP kinase
MSPHPIPGGLLVVFEGIDGAGKSTQIERLVALARERGHECVASREPTYGPYGRQLRESARSGRLAVEDEHRLLLLDRRQHVDELIAPALGRGAVVVLDRYYFSSVAYQSGGALSAEQILADNRAFAPTPDLLLLLDLPVEIGLARIGARDAKPDAFESLATLTRCREVFLGFATLPYARLIDATQSVDAMAADVAAAFALAVDRKFERCR